MKRQTADVLAVITTALLLCSASTAVSAGQNEDEQLSRNMAATMQDARNSEAGNPQELALEKVSPGKVLAELKKYAGDPDSRVRGRTFDLAGRVLKRSADRGTREQALRYMLSMVVSDPEPLTARSSSESLVARDLRAADFTDEMKQWIHGLVQQKNRYPADLLLAGIADVQSARPRLNELAPQQWAACLALARMGDKQQIDYCIAKFKAEGNTVRRIWLLGNIAYIRQPEAIAVLVQDVFSEKREPSTDPEDYPGMPYSYRALEYLLMSVDGIPQTMNIAVARKWLEKQGDVAKLKIKR